ncbi:MAG: hypothetical protein SGJ20_19945 [Planctomycetota bacterium]|nr:hypothetical protein [Planctomycetota bacterium]
MFLSKNGFQVKFVPLTFEVGGSQIIVRLAEPFYFQGWPYRAVAGQAAKIDILAEFTETVSLADGRSTRTSLQVNYFSCDGDRRIACDAIHYDFSSTVQPRHPVCHAQASNAILSVLPEGFPADRDVSSLAGRHQAVRIPSAFVNLAGLFAKIVADHLPPDAVAEFWSVCKVYIDKLPDHASTQLSDGIFELKSLKSYSWYAW